MFTLLETCLQGTAMPLVLLAVRPCLRRHVPSRVLRALWIVAFVWLLLPVRPSLPDVPHLTVTLPAVTAVVDFGKLGGAALPVIVDATSLATPNDAAARIPLLDGLLAAQAVLGARLGTVAVSYSLGPVPIGPILLVGMCGAAACLLYLSLTSLFTHRRLLKMPQLRRPEMDAWSRGHRLRRPLLVCRVPQTAPHAPGTSVTSGFLYPVIAVPDDIASGDWDALELVLEHEFTHARRCDPLVKVAMAAVACLNWFNPVVWLALRRACQDIELSCDERVVAGLDRVRQGRYAMLLIDVSQAGAAARSQSRRDRRDGRAGSRAGHGLASRHEGLTTHATTGLLSMAARVTTGRAPSDARAVGGRASRGHARKGPLGERVCAIVSPAGGRARKRACAAVLVASLVAVTLLACALIRVAPGTTDVALRQASRLAPSPAAAEASVAIPDGALIVSDGVRAEVVDGDDGTRIALYDLS